MVALRRLPGRVRCRCVHLVDMLRVPYGTAPDLCCAFMLIHHVRFITPRPCRKIACSGLWYYPIFFLHEGNSSTRISAGMVGAAGFLPAIIHRWETTAVRQVISHRQRVRCQQQFCYTDIVIRY